MASKKDNLPQAVENDMEQETPLPTLMRWSPLLLVSPQARWKGLPACVR